MVIRNELFHSGVDLEEGYRIIGDEYDIRVDDTPDELVDEFLEEYERDDRESLVEFVEDTVEHSYAVARDRGLSQEEVEQERIESQGSISGAINMSDVWDGSWNGIVGGSCQERAVTLQQMMKELGFDAKYVSGNVEVDGSEEGHAWVETGDGYIADPSSVGGFYEKDYSDRTRSTAVIQGNF